MKKPARRAPIDLEKLQSRRECVFLLLAGLFLGTLAMLNIVGISRFLVLASWGPVQGHTVFQWGVPNRHPEAWVFAVAVGVLPYPVTFLCTDLISEFFGRKRANTVVLVGLLLNLWVIFVIWVGAELPGFVALDPETRMPPLPEFDAAQGKYLETGWTFFQIKNLTYGAVMASMIAYLVAQFLDVHMFHFWKKFTRGKHLWLRNNGSTIISQFVDTVAVILITQFWAAALPPTPAGRSLAVHLALFIATGYAYKLFAALIDTPILYLAVRVLSRYLRIDPVVAEPVQTPLFAS